LYEVVGESELNEKKPAPEMIVVTMQLLFFAGDVRNLDVVGGEGKLSCFSDKFSYGCYA